MKNGWKKKTEEKDKMENGVDRGTAKIIERKK